MAKKLSNSVLAKADEIVNGARRSDYGHPLDNHSLTGTLFALYLRKRYPGIQITATDVCFFNVLQKISRVATTDKITFDSLVDIAGYAANVQLVVDELAKRKTAIAEVTVLRKKRRKPKVNPVIAFVSPGIYKHRYSNNVGSLYGNAYD